MASGPAVLSWGTRLGRGMCPLRAETCAPACRGIGPHDAETCTPPCRGLHPGRQLRLSRGWAQPLYAEDYTFGGAPEEAPLEVPPPRRGLLPFRVPSELGGIPQELIEHGGELGVFEEEAVVPIV